MAPDEMAETMRRPRVALFGEVLADVFPDRQVLGGAPFNVARHLYGFGAHAMLISRTGNDALRQQVMASMGQCGMDVRGVQNDPLRPTGQVHVRMRPGGEHAFEILPEQAYDYIDPDLACQAALAVQPDVVYFGTLAQRQPASRAALDALLDSCKALRLLDLNLRPPWYDAAILLNSLQHADILKLNEAELSELGALLGLHGQDRRQLAADLLARFDLRSIVVTCGGDGAWQVAARQEGVRYHASPAVAAEVVDTVGAGDGFSAVLILGEAWGWPVEVTMQRAGAFAAAVCGLRGAVPEDDAFYAPFRQQWFPAGVAQ